MSTNGRMNNERTGQVYLSPISVFSCRGRSWLYLETYAYYLIARIFQFCGERICEKR